MPWQNVKLGDIDPNPSFPPIAEGEYTFQLLPGAHVRDRKMGVNQETGEPFMVEELVTSAAIAEGDSKGRRVFLQYPDPEAVSPSGKSFGWSANALKKLEVALGEDQAEGESASDYLNRVATTSTSLFKGTISHRTYTKEGSDTPVIQEQFNLFSVAPAA